MIEVVTKKKLPWFLLGLVAITLIMLPTDPSDIIIMALMGPKLYVLACVLLLFLVYLTGTHTYVIRKIKQMIKETRR